MERKLRSSVLAAYTFLWVGFVGVSPVGSVPLSYNTGVEHVTTLFTPRYTTGSLSARHTYGPFGSHVNYIQSLMVQH
jgi:hypothetical protein